MVKKKGFFLFISEAALKRKRKDPFSFFVQQMVLQLNAEGICKMRLVYIH